MSDYVSMVASVFSADMQLGPTYETVSEFDRTADAGLINVLNVKLGEDLKQLYPFPPAVVNDLEVTEMSYENKTVTLSWTAVGDYDEQETGENKLLSLYKLVVLLLSSLFSEVSLVMVSLFVILVFFLSSSLFSHYVCYQQSRVPSTCCCCSSPLFALLSKSPLTQSSHSNLSCPRLLLLGICSSCLFVFSHTFYMASISNNSVSCFK